MTTSPSAIASTLCRGLSGPTGGATVWLSPERHDGYLVGVPSVSRSIAIGRVSVSATFIATWVHHRLADPSGYATVGSWLNPNGNADFDACDWHADLGSALSIGRERGELAIWDIAGDVAEPTGVAS